MRKIPSIFQRNFGGDELLRDEPNPECEWVFLGEGVATRKFDGTACLIRNGELYKRYDAKGGRTPPVGWEACQPAADPVTGHWPGWIKVSGTSPEDRWHREVVDRYKSLGMWPLLDGTYELCGPKLQSNPEGFDEHMLLRHGGMILANVPRFFTGLKQYLTDNDIEGVVFHHPDGRMAKIKRVDFGLAWGPHKAGESRRKSRG